MFWTAIIINFYQFLFCGATIYLDETESEYDDIENKFYVIKWFSCINNNNMIQLFWVIPIGNYCLKILRSIFFSLLSSHIIVWSAIEIDFEFGKLFIAIEIKLEYL